MTNSRSTLSKFLSLLIALTMVLSMAPTAVFAAELEEPEIVVDETVENGDDENSDNGEDETVEDNEDEIVEDNEDEIVEDDNGEDENTDNGEDEIVEDNEEDEIVEDIVAINDVIYDAPTPATFAVTDSTIGDTGDTTEIILTFVGAAPATIAASKITIGSGNDVGRATVIGVATAGGAGATAALTVEVQKAGDAKIAIANHASYAFTASTATSNVVTLVKKSDIDEFRLKDIKAVATDGTATVSQTGVGAKEYKLGYFANGEEATLAVTATLAQPSQAVTTSPEEIAVGLVEGYYANGTFVTREDVTTAGTVALTAIASGSLTYTGTIAVTDNSATKAYTLVTFVGNNPLAEEATLKITVAEDATKRISTIAITDNTFFPPVAGKATPATATYAITIPTGSNYTGFAASWGGTFEDKKIVYGEEYTATYSFTATNDFVFTDDTALVINNSVYTDPDIDVSVNGKIATVSVTSESNSYDIYNIAASVAATATTGAISVTVPEKTDKAVVQQLIVDEIYATLGSLLGDSTFDNDKEGYTVAYTINTPANFNTATTATTAGIFTVSKGGKSATAAATKGPQVIVATAAKVNSISVTPDSVKADGSESVTVKINANNLTTANVATRAIVAVLDNADVKATVAIPAGSNMSYTVTIPAAKIPTNGTTADKDYTIAVALDGKLLTYAPASAALTVRGKPSISKINVPARVSGNNTTNTFTATVAGLNLNDASSVTLTAATGGVSATGTVEVATNGETGTASITLSRNMTGAPRTLTITNNLNATKATTIQNAASVVSNVSAKPDVVQFNTEDVITATISGTSLPAGLHVGLYTSVGADAEPVKATNGTPIATIAQAVSSDGKVVNVTLPLKGLVNDSTDNQKYFLRVSEDGNTFYNRAVQIIQTGKYEITDIETDVAELDYKGGDVEVTLVGDNLDSVKDQKIFTYSWFRTLDYGTASDDSNWATIGTTAKTIVLPANEREIDELYTIRAHVTGYPETAVETEVRVKRTPVVTDIAVDKTALESVGGVVEVTVTGESMIPGEVEVAAFVVGTSSGTTATLADSSDPATSAKIDKNGKATLGLTANDATAAVTYVILAKATDADSYPEAVDTSKATVKTVTVAKVQPITAADLNVLPDLKVEAGKPIPTQAELEAFTKGSKYTFDSNNINWSAAGTAGSDPNKYFALGATPAATFKLNAKAGYVFNVTGTQAVTLAGQKAEHDAVATDARTIDNINVTFGKTAATAQVNAINLATEEAVADASLPNAITTSTEIGYTLDGAAKWQVYVPASGADTATWTTPTGSPKHGDKLSLTYNVKAVDGFSLTGVKVIDDAVHIEKAEYKGTATKGTVTYEFIPVRTAVTVESMTPITEDGGIGRTNEIALEFAKAAYITLGDVAINPASATPASAGSATARSVDSYATQAYINLAPFVESGYVTVTLRDNHSAYKFVGGSQTVKVDAGEVPAAIKSISISEKEDRTSMMKNADGEGKLQFKATVKDVNGKEIENPDVIWEIEGETSEGTAINVDTGVLTIDAEETSRTITVKATAIDNTTVARQKIKVTGFVDRVNLNPKSITIKVGQEYTLNAKAEGDVDIANENVGYVVADVINGVAATEALTAETADIISGNKVKGKKVGTARVKATSVADPSVYEYCYVTVVADVAPATKGDLKLAIAAGTAAATDVANGDEKSYTYVKGNTNLKLTVSIHNDTASPATVPVIKWDSSDKKVATVDAKGVIKHVGPGFTRITAAYKDKNATGKPAEFILVLNDDKPRLPVTTITVIAGSTEGTNFTMYKGDNGTIDFTTIPAIGNYTFTKVDAMTWNVKHIATAAKGATDKLTLKPNDNDNLAVALTVKLITAAPKASVNWQKQTLNPFFKGEEVELLVTGKDLPAIESIALKNDGKSGDVVSNFTLYHDGRSNTAKVRFSDKYDFTAKKTVVKGLLEVKYKGIDKAAEIAVTVPVKKVVPKLTIDPKAPTIITSQGKFAYITLNKYSIVKGETKTPEVASIEWERRTGTSADDIKWNKLADKNIANFEAIGWDYARDQLVFEIKESKATSYAAVVNVMLKDANEPVQLKVTIKTAKAITYKLSKTSLNFSSKNDESWQELAIEPNVQNVEIFATRIDFQGTAAPDFITMGGSETGVNWIGVRVAKEAPVGTYKYNVWTNDENQTKPLVLTIKVTQKDPAQPTMKASGSINLLDRGNYAEYLDQDPKVAPSEADANSPYITLKPTFKDTAVLDNYGVRYVWLVPDAKEKYSQDDLHRLFGIASWSDGEVELFANTDEDINNGATAGSTLYFEQGYAYKFSIAYLVWDGTWLQNAQGAWYQPEYDLNMAPTEGDNVYFYTMLSKPITVKPTNAVKPVVDPKTVTMYQSAAKINSAVATIKSGVANIESISIKADAKLDLNEAFGCNLDKDGNIYIYIKDASKVKVGKSTITIQAIYDGQPNIKPKDKAPQYGVEHNPVVTEIKVPVNVLNPVAK